MSSLLGAVQASFGQVLNASVTSPQTSLCILFCLYKSLLDIIAFCAPGDGFDSSTILSGWPEGGPLSKLVKWDGIWFTNLAQRGYKYEQDFAFGYGYTNFLSFGQYLWPSGDFEYSIHREGAFGILVSHVSHILGALILYRITLMVFRNHEQSQRIAFLASAFHIISPAGIFICAPYTEAPFSLLKFGAYYAYASSTLDHMDGKHGLRDAQLLIAGGLLGTACTFRSNGLLSGVIFALDAVEDGLLFLQHRGDFARFRKIAVTVVAGSLIAIGQMYPQYIAWKTFCTDMNPFEKRPFCYNFPPSIYTYVQSVYWDVGFLKYWQPKQIPLFILATPILFAMFYSTYWVFTMWRDPPITIIADNDEDVPLVQTPATLERISGDRGKALPVPQVDMRLMIRFTIPQTLIAFTCLFMVHVQIVTRLSSSYPVWYWWLTTLLLDYVSGEESTVTNGWKKWIPWFYSRWTIMYGIIQAGLYAEMLPPA